MSREADGVFDPGLQAERTALAWRRTALAFAAAALGAGRIAAPAIGLAAVVMSVAGLGLAVLVAAGASRRYRAAHRSLVSRGDLRGTAGAGPPVLAMAASGLLVGGLALAFVLGRAL